MSGVWGVARADFLEKFRRFSFVAMMALSLFAAFWLVPRNDGSVQLIAIQPDRFVQAGNPSWIPVTSAWGLGIILPLIGFFYLRNTIAFDEKSGVMQLVSSSPIGYTRYMFGKLCSGTLLLYCFASAVILGSFFIMLWLFPGQLLSVYQFFSHFIFLLIILP
jgi:ABC-type transport system involved in multi-copper enzyme maturation permease subunit